MEPPGKAGFAGFDFLRRGESALDGGEDGSRSTDTTQRIKNWLLEAS